MAKRSKADRKRRKREERIRQDKHRRRSQPRDREEEDLPREFDQERILRALALARGDWSLSLQDLAEAWLASEGPAAVVGPGEAPQATPAEQAQELAFRAMEAEDPEDAQDLVEDALELDPSCGDALSLRIQFAGTGAGRRQRLETLAAALEREPAPPAPAGPHLGRQLRARPFLRVLETLVLDAAEAHARDDLVLAYTRLAGLDHTAGWMTLGLALTLDRDAAARLRPLAASDAAGALALDGLLALGANERARALACFRQLSACDLHLWLALSRPHEIEVWVDPDEQRNRALAVAFGLEPLVHASGFVAWFDAGMPTAEVS